MLRREFIKKMGAACAAGAIVPNALASSTHTKPKYSVKQLFNQALSNNQNLIGFQNVKQNYGVSNLLVEGDIPQQIKGTFLRNGPAKHERGEQRYSHLFEGDGMLQKFSIADGKIQHIGRFIETPKFTTEQKAGKFLFSGPDTHLPDSLPVLGPDSINTANTSVIAVNDELWALWEAGSATAIDPETLSYKRQVNLGENNHYGDTLKGLPFSAHPKVEANGDIWNFGLNMSGHVVVYHLGSKGQLKKLKLLPTQYKGGILHDFLITQDYVLLILPSLVMQKGKQGFFGSINMDSDLPMRVLVLDKNTLNLQKQYELPSGFAFHFGNAYQDKEKNIHFDMSVYNDIGVMHEFSHLMRGNTQIEASHAHTALVTLYSNGKTNITHMSGTSEFPSIAKQQVGLNNRWLFHVSSKQKRVWSDSVVAIDFKNERRYEFNYGSDFLVEEHIPILINQTESKGYLIGTALHVPSKRSCLNLFDINKLEQGPMARAWLNTHLPLGFHGHFIEA